MDRLTTRKIHPERCPARSQGLRHHHSHLGCTAFLHPRGSGRRSRTKGSRVTVELGWCRSDFGRELGSSPQEAGLQWSRRCGGDPFSNESCQNESNNEAEFGHPSRGRRQLYMPAHPEWKFHSQALWRSTSSQILHPAVTFSLSKRKESALALLSVVNLRQWRSASLKAASLGFLRIRCTSENTFLTGRKHGSRFEGKAPPLRQGVLWELRRKQTEKRLRLAMEGCRVDKS